MVKNSTVEISKLSSRGLLILDSAQQLFYQHGFDETSLAMIINKAGGSRRSIYNEFGSKEGLLMAVIQRQVKVQSDILSSIDRNLAAKEALNQVCIKFVKGMLSPVLMSLFRLIVQQVVKFPELGEIIYEKGLMTGIVPLIEYIEWLAEQKVIKVNDSLFSAQILIEMSKGSLHTRCLLLLNSNVSDEEITEHVAKVVDKFLDAHKP